jgi:hypothetical protein
MHDASLSFTCCCGDVQWSASWVPVLRDLRVTQLRGACSMARTAAPPPRTMTVYLCAGPAPVHQLALASRLNLQSQTGVRSGLVPGAPTDSHRVPGPTLLPPPPMFMLSKSLFSCSSAQSRIRGAVHSSTLHIDELLPGRRKSGWAGRVGVRVGGGGARPNSSQPWSLIIGRGLEGSSWSTLEVQNRPTSKAQCAARCKHRWRGLQRSRTIEGERFTIPEHNNQVCTAWTAKAQLSVVPR